MPRSACTASAAAACAPSYRSSLPLPGMLLLPPLLPLLLLLLL
jgi:hypothetical protein